MGNTFSCAAYSVKRNEHEKPNLPPPPPEKKLDELYEKLLTERGISPSVREEMIRFQNSRTKWYIVFFNGKEYANERKNKWTPSTYVDQLLILQYGGNGLIDLLNEINFNMITYSSVWVHDFVSAGGINALLKFLPSDTKDLMQSDQYNEILKLMTTIVNYNSAIEEMAATNECAQGLFNCLHVKSHRVKSRALQLLSVICYHSNEGHQRVLSCFSNYSVTEKKEVRFGFLIQEVISPDQSLSLKANLLTFINIMINSALNLNTRVSIRTDMIYSGLLDYIDLHRCAHQHTERNQALETQMEVFETQYESDRKETIYKEIDLADIESIFDALYSKTKENNVYTKFVQILKHLLLVPSERKFGIDIWNLIENAVKKITTKTLDKDAQNIFDIQDEKKLLELSNQLEVILKHETGKDNNEPTKNISIVPEGQNVTSDKLLDHQNDKPHNLKKEFSENLQKELAKKLERNNENEVSNNSENDINQKLKNELIKKLENKEKKTIPESSKEDELQKISKEDVHEETLNNNKTMMIKDHPDYAKYFKLIKLGMPMDQVKLKASSEGIDSSKLDLPPETILEEKRLIKVKDHPKYMVYFKLQKLGMPIEQIQLKMKSEKVDCNMLFHPDLLVEESTGELIAADKMKILENNNETISSSSIGSSSPAPSDNNNNSPAPENESNKPKRKVRAIYWERLKAEAVEGTIWTTQNEELVKYRINEKDVPDLTTLFSSIKNVKTTSNQSSDNLFNSTKKVFLLDHSRANNMSIVIKKLKMDKNQIRQAILKFDDSCLQVEHLQALLSVMPTEEELKILSMYKGDIAKLNDPEQLFLNLMSIPRLSQRLQIFILILQYDAFMKELNEKMKTIESACDEILQCDKFNIVLNMVLDLGNIMNEGTSHGEAYGFHINDLQKLNQIKGVDNKITIIHYLARLVRERNPNLLHFGKELPNLTKVQTISTCELINDMKTLAETQSILQNELKLHETLPRIEYDLFQEKVKGFMQYAQEKVRFSTQLYATMEKNLLRTRSFYCDETNDLISSSSRFFESIYQFSESLCQSDEENQAELLQKQQREQRRRATSLVIKNRDSRIKEEQTNENNQTCNKNYPLNLSPLSRTSSLRDIDQFKNLKDGSKNKIMEAFQVRRDIELEKRKPSLKLDENNNHRKNPSMKSFKKKKISRKSLPALDIDDERNEVSSPRSIERERLVNISNNSPDSLSPTKLKKLVVSL